MTMPAVVLTTNGRIALKDRPRPTLWPDQVLVEVDLCGICGSDLHASQLPQVYRGDCILGHESTGRVAAVGDDVADWVAGQRVAVNPNGNVDGTCEHCRSGRPNFCRQATLETALGLQADGALAPLMATFPGHLRRIPDELGTLEAAWVEPTATALRAIELAGELAGRTVLVTGGGRSGSSLAGSLTSDRPQRSFSWSRQRNGPSSRTIPMPYRSLPTKPQATQAEWVSTSCSSAREAPLPLLRR